MTWIDFPLYSSIIAILWIIGLVFLIRSYKKPTVFKIASALFIIGWLVMILFVVKIKFFRRYSLAFLNFHPQNVFLDAISYR